MVASGNGGVGGRGEGMTRSPRLSVESTREEGKSGFWEASVERGQCVRGRSSSLYVGGSGVAGTDIAGVEG